MSSIRTLVVLLVIFCVAVELGLLKWDKKLPEIDTTANSVEQSGRADASGG